MPARLDEAHRLAQTRIGADTVRRMLAAWAVLDVDDLDSSFQRWLLVVLPIIRGQRVASALLAANYYNAARTIELGVGDFNVKLADAIDVEQVSTSMLVTGPVSMRASFGRGVPAAKASEIASARSAAAAMRHALNGGRETIAQSLSADPKATGWRRTTSGKACAFCSMLAGRGAVYGKDSVDFAAHDHCSCGIAPAWGEQPTRDVRDYAPSARHLTDEQRQIRNERVRDFIARN